MRITFVHKTANFSGGNRVVAGYAERLAQRGHEVFVCTGRDLRPTPLRALINRVKGRTFPVGDGRSWLDDIDPTRVEHRAIDCAGPLPVDALPDADVIVATWWETAEWIAHLPARKGHKAYFLQGVEWTIEDMPRERVRQTWRLPMHKIVIAEFMADIARDEFGDDDISHVPNAVDTELFHASPRELGEPPTVGLMQVGPSVIKGGDVTHEALLLAKERLPSLVGKSFGRSLPPASRPLPDWVQMSISPSPQSLTALYSSCDVFIHGARVEGFGLPLLEAMACRTPVVATPAGAAPELLPEGGGMLVPHEDPRAMADALVAMCTLPAAEWRARSEAAHRRATGYSWTDATAGMEAALERAIAKGREGTHVSAAAGCDEWGASTTRLDEEAGASRLAVVDGGAASEAGADPHVRVRPFSAQAVAESVPGAHGLIDFEPRTTAAGLICALRSAPVVDGLRATLRAPRLYRDPVGRHDGIVNASVGGGAANVTTGTPWLDETRLRLAFTVLAPLGDAPEGAVVELHTLEGGHVADLAVASGNGVVIEAGQSYALRSPMGPLRAVRVHYYVAGTSEDTPARVDWRGDDSRAARYRKWLRCAANEHLERARARLWERYFGLA